MSAYRPPTAQIGLDRVHYFPRQLITADDMRAEQEYFREKLRRHNRYLHSWGVVCGCQVKAPSADEPAWQVTVGPGYLITPHGDEIEIAEAVKFDLASDWRQGYDPCARVSPCQPIGVQSAAQEPQTVYLAVCYAECETRPVRVHPVGCACDEAACEYSRIRDSFELVRLIELPESHKKTKKANADWYNTYQDWVEVGFTSPRPVSSCLEYPEDNCVVLAKITLPKARNTQIVTGDIQ
jgi:hypothetical protein